MKTFMLPCGFVASRRRRGEDFFSSFTFNHQYSQQLRFKILLVYPEGLVIPADGGWGGVWGGVASVDARVGLVGGRCGVMGGGVGWKSRSFDTIRDLWLNVFVVGSGSQPQG